MSRRKHERGQERLRTAWTSTDDLEETLTSMFLVTRAAPAPPPDNLTREAAPQSPDNLSSANSTEATSQSPSEPPDSLKSPQVPPDNLTADKAPYITLDGTPVQAKFVRPYRLVQEAHTPSEHIVYTTMYRMAGDHDPAKDSREAILPMQAIARRTAISLRNIRRILRSLEAKFSIEITEFEDKIKAIPRRYRVWGMNAILERRRRNGYEFVYRNRNLITLARPTFLPAPPVNLSGYPPVNLAAPPPVSLPAVPPVNQSSEPPVSLTPFIEIPPKNSLANDPSPAVVAAIHRHFGFVDDNAIHRIVAASRRAAPDVTADEIAWAVTLTAGRIRAMRNLTNPVGMLITQVPRCFEGASFRLYRESERQRREAENQERDRWCREARAILADPASSAEDRDWARAVLEMES